MLCYKCLLGRMHFCLNFCNGFSLRDSERHFKLGRRNTAVSACENTAPQLKEQRTGSLQTCADDDEMETVQLNRYERNCQNVPIPT